MISIRFGSLRRENGEDPRIYEDKNDGDGLVGMLRRLLVMQMSFMMMLRWLSQRYWLSSMHLDSDFNCD